MARQRFIAPAYALFRRFLFAHIVGDEIVFLIGFDLRPHIFGFIVHAGTVSKEAIRDDIGQQAFRLKFRPARQNV